MSIETEQLIELISSQTRVLLQNHWPNLLDCRDGDGEVKVAFTHSMSEQGHERTVKTVISYGRRIKDELEESINTKQIDLPLDGAKRGKR